MNYRIENGVYIANDGYVFTNGNSVMAKMLKLNPNDSINNYDVIEEPVEEIIDEPIEEEI